MFSMRAGSLVLKANRAEIVFFFYASVYSLFIFLSQGLVPAVFRRFSR